MKLIAELLSRLITRVWSIAQSFRVQRNIMRFSILCELGKNFRCGPNATCLNESGERAAIKVGDNVELLGNLSALGPGKITIGSHSTIRACSEVQAIDSVTIGNHVIISNNVLITDNNNHPTCPRLRLEMSQNGTYSELWHWRYSDSRPVKIDNNVWIGRYATILKGVNIGEGSIVACNALVTKDVPPYSVVAGNPARVVKTLNPIGKK